MQFTTIIKTMTSFYIFPSAVILSPILIIYGIRMILIIYGFFHQLDSASKKHYNDKVKSTEGR